MKKIIYNAFFAEGDNVKSPNFKINNYGSDKNNYLKTSYVSLRSAKLSNPDIDVALVTNQPLEPSVDILFKQAGIKVFIVPFLKYRMPKDFQWEYAFYKLQALDYMLTEEEYDDYLALDIDTYIHSDLSEFWKECEYGLPILYPLTASGQERDRGRIETDYQKLFEEKKAIPQMGGEFIGGSREALIKLLNEISQIYQKIEESDFNINKLLGDEALLSIAASSIATLSARPFVGRYWVRRYYDADFQCFNIPIWHLPSEKNYGLLKAFDIMQKDDRLLTQKEAMRLFNLPKQQKYNLSMLKYYIFKIIHK